MPRYSLHIITSPDCDAYDPAVLHETDSLEWAKHAATHHSVVQYGVCVRDARTRLVDYGHGFGVRVELPESADDEVTEIIPDIEAHNAALLADHERSSSH
jgi:hypothetical protein